MRNQYNIISSLLIVSLILTGCTSSSTQQKRTVQGTILGAALGAVIGHQSDDTTEGALIGAVVGGTVGYIIGGVETKTVKDAENTEKIMDYSKADGIKVNISSISVEPTKVKPGEETDLITQISLAAPEQNKDIKVKQRIAIFHNGEQVGNTIEKTFTFKAGTHQIIRSITFQDEADSGEYTFVTHISAQLGSEKDVDYLETNFEVL
ncbi:MAG: glycine zipper family protein [Candidatus Hydrogenedentota bacterium]